MTDTITKEKLDELCDIRQPVLFLNTNHSLMDINYKTMFEQYPSYTMCLRNSHETNFNSEIYLQVSLTSALTLIAEKDKDANFYYSEKNEDLLKNTGLHRRLSYSYLKPYAATNCNYDFLLGAENSFTPLRYEVSYRNYILVTQGSIEIKLFPPNVAHLDPVLDYLRYEFRSSMLTPWEDDHKCIQLIIPTNRILYIPAYWWYTIRFQKESSLLKFQYNTLMNHITTLPFTFLHLLQKQNTKTTISTQIS